MQKARGTAFLAIIAIGAVGCVSAPKRIAGIPRDYVRTPNGIFHRSCVRTVAQGDRIDDQGNVTHVNGTREKLPQCTHPRLDAATLQPLRSSELPPPTGTSWVEYASWQADAQVNVGALTATFTVPQAPSAPGGLIYLFPGLISAMSPPNTILQPVLESGPCDTGSGNCWTASSWYCCPGSGPTHTEPFSVNADDVIVGKITCSGVPCTWSVEITDSTTGVSAVLMPVTNTGFPIVLGGVLEQYNIQSCGQYPATGQTAFDVALTDQSGNPLQPIWSPTIVGTLPPCAYNVLPSTPAPGKVTLIY